MYICIYASIYIYIYIYIYLPIDIYINYPLFFLKHLESFSDCQVANVSQDFSP